MKTSHLQTRLLPYLIAIGTVILATLLKKAIDPVPGGLFIYSTYLFAVMITAWYGGFGPSLLAIILGALAADYFFVPPLHHFSIRDVSTVLGMGAYFGVGLIALAFSQARERAQYQAKIGAVEAQRIAAQRTLQVQELGIALGKVLSVNKVAEVALDYFMKVLNGSAGAVTLLENGTIFRILYYKNYPAAQIEQWQTFPTETRLPITDALDTRQPVWIESRIALKNRYPALEKWDGGHSGAGISIPLILDEEPIGGLGLSFEEARTFNDSERAFIMTLAQQCALAMARGLHYEAERQARHEAQQAQDRLRFLAEASALLATSLDYRTTLQAVARLTVPHLADWCTIHVPAETGDMIETLAVAHPDPDKVAFVQQLQERYPHRISDSYGIAETIRSGKSQIHNGLTDEILKGSTVNEEHFALLRQTTIRASMLVPIIGREKILGALTLTSSHPERQFNAADLALAEELARRAASAIENSLLYQQAAHERERLTVTLASIGDAVIATDTDGNITFINTVAQALTGWPAHEAIGQPLEQVFNITNEETGLSVENPVKQVLKQRSIVGLANHTLLIARDGRVLPIDDSGAPILTVDGKLLGAILVFRDISERRRSEIELKNQNEIIQRVHQVGQMLAAELDLQKLVQSITDTATELCRAEFGAFFYNLINDKGESYTLYTISGVPRSNFEKFPMPRNTALFGPTFRGEGVVRIMDVREDARYAQNDPYYGMPKGHLPVVSYLAVPVISRSGEVLGGLFFGHHEPDKFTEYHEQLVVGLAGQAAIAMDNARLHEEALKVAALEERQRLARDLHDAVTQTLFSSTIITDALLRTKDSNKVMAELEQVYRLNRGALAEMRNLLLELRPAGLVDIPLDQLFTQLANAAMGRSQIEVEVTVTCQTPLTTDTRLILHRIAQEALNNIVKHAKATRASIHLDESEGELVMKIQDNGRGFEMEKVGADHLGLKIMRERAAQMNAQVDITSQPNEGTIVTVRYALE